MMSSDSEQVFNPTVVVDKELSPEEILAKEAIKFYGLLKSFHENVYPDLTKRLAGLSDSSPDAWQHIVDILRAHLVGISKALNFVSEDKTLAAYYKHDLKNIAVYVKNFFELLCIDKGNELDGEVKKSTLQTALNAWPRFYTAFQDVLLRGVSIEDLPSVNENFDTELMQGVALFIATKEKARLHGWLDDARSGRPAQYERAADKEFLVDIDPQLNEKLKGKEIVGNNAIILNLVVKELQNAFKKEHELSSQTKVVFQCVVEGDDIVLRVMDNGRGISFERLDPANDKYIGKKGVSHDGSTGLGLAEARERIRAIGGEWRVFSLNNEDKSVSGFSSNSDNVNPTQAQSQALDWYVQTNFKRLSDGKPEMRTFMEIRIPIKDKSQE